jgi:hypothetical protein
MAEACDLSSDSSDSEDKDAEENCPNFLPKTRRGKLSKAMIEEIDLIRKQWEADGDPPADLHQPRHPGRSLKPDREQYMKWPVFTWWPEKSFDMSL